MGLPNSFSSSEPFWGLICLKVVGTFHLYNTIFLFLLSIFTPKSKITCGIILILKIGINLSVGGLRVFVLGLNLLQISQIRSSQALIWSLIEFFLHFTQFHFTFMISSTQRGSRKCITWIFENSLVILKYLDYSDSRNVLEVLKTLKILPFLGLGKPLFKIMELRCYSVALCRNMVLFLWPMSEVKWSNTGVCVNSLSDSLKFSFFDWFYIFVVRLFFPHALIYWSVLMLLECVKYVIIDTYEWLGILLVCDFES